MPISGHLVPGITENVPTRSFFLLGADGNHYIIAGNVNEVAPSCAETLTTPHPITSTQWNTDLVALAPSGYNAGLTYIMDECILPIAGASKYYVTGGTNDGSQTVFLRYRINADSTQSVDGGVILTNDISAGNTGPNRPYAYNTIGSTSYAAVWGFHGSFSDGAYYLVAIPNSGSFSGNASSYFTQFQTATGTYFASTTARQYTSRAAIIGDPAGIKILSYVGKSEITGGPPAGSTLTTPGCEYWIVDPVGQTVVKSLTNCQAAFGQPWADSGTLYGGGASSNSRDDYVAPIVNVVSGGYELIFARPFSDNYTVFRFRRYFVSGTTGAISYVDTFEQTISAGQGGVSQVEMPFAVRDGGDLLFAASNQTDWWFGQFTLAAPAGPTASGSTHFVERITDVFDDNKADDDMFFVDAGFVPQSVKLATSGVEGFDGLRVYQWMPTGARNFDATLGGMDIGTGSMNQPGIIDFPFNGDFTLAYVQSFNSVLAGSTVTLTGNQVAIDGGTSGGNRVYYLAKMVVGWTYTSQGQLLRPDFREDAGAKNGPAFGELRRNHKYAALLYRTQAIKFGTDFGTTLYDAPLNQADGVTAVAQPTLFSGVVRTTIADDYSTDGMIAFQQTRPVPGQVLSIAGRIETQDE